MSCFEHRIDLFKKFIQHLLDQRTILLNLTYIFHRISLLLSCIIFLNSYFSAARTKGNLGET